MMIVNGPMVESRSRNRERPDGRVTIALSTESAPAMVTLYVFQAAQRHPYPTHSPMTYVKSESYSAAARALRRGEAYELWEDGRCIARGGPASDLACPARLRV